MRTDESVYEVNRVERMWSTEGDRKFQQSFAYERFRFSPMTRCLPRYLSIPPSFILHFETRSR